jgi:uncharacterized protein
MTSSDAPVVIDDIEASRYVTTIDGHEAELVYERDGDRVVLVHTGVPEELGGRGVGGALVRHALAAAAAGGWSLVPQCPFARRWLERHPGEVGGVTVHW